MPVKVLDNVRTVCLSDSHSAAITMDGDLYCWGWNSVSQIGNDTARDQLWPIKILGNASVKYMLGDVTKDGKITMEDVYLILKFALKAEIPTADDVRLAADITGEGNITLTDVQHVLKYVLRISSVLGK